MRFDALALSLWIDPNGSRVPSHQDLPFRGALAVACGKKSAEALSAVMPFRFGNFALYLHADPVITAPAHLARVSLAVRWHIQNERTWHCRIPFDLQFGAIGMHVAYCASHFRVRRALNYSRPLQHPGAMKALKCLRWKCLIIHRVMVSFKSFKSLEPELLTLQLAWVPVCLSKTVRSGAVVSFVGETHSADLAFTETRTHSSALFWGLFMIIKAERMSPGRPSR